MKIRLTLKDPDGVYESLQAAAVESVNAIEGIDEDEKQDLVESRKEKIDEQCKKFIKWGEYVEIEIDTDAQTATVIPCS